MTWQSDEHSLSGPDGKKSDAREWLKTIVMGIVGTALLAGGLYGLVVWK